MKLFIALALLSVALAFPKAVEEEEPFREEPFEEERAERSVAVVGENRLWKNGIVYYAFDHTAEPLRSLVQQAMSHIQKDTCIRFRENYGQNRIYITSRSEGCTSPNGMTGGQQTLNLGKGCKSFGIILHQLGHALGLLHEHTRSDRDKYVNILWENIIPGKQHLFVQLSPSKNRLLSPFDYQSVMMFGEYDYNRIDSGLKTITPINPGVRLTPLREKKALSSTDVAKINQLYKCNEP